MNEGGGRASKQKKQGEKGQQTVLNDSASTHPVSCEAAEDLSDEGGEDDDAPAHDEAHSQDTQQVRVAVPSELSPPQLWMGGGGGG